MFWLFQEPSPLYDNNHYHEECLKCNSCGLNLTGPNQKRARRWVDTIRNFQHTKTKWQSYQNFSYVTWNLEFISETGTTDDQKTKKWNSRQKKLKSSWKNVYFTFQRCSWDFWKICKSARLFELWIYIVYYYLLWIYIVNDHSGHFGSSGVCRTAHITEMNFINKK